MNTELAAAFSTYQPLAMRTLNADLSQEQQLISGALGLCGELSELDPEIPTTDEAGDVAWYLALLCQATEQNIGVLYLAASKPELPIVPDAWRLHYGMTYHAGQIADRVKKIAMHSHPFFPSDFTMNFQGAMYYFLAFCEHHSLNVKTILEQNVEKLKRRYPAGFSSQASLNRVI